MGIMPMGHHDQGIHVEKETPPVVPVNRGEMNPRGC
jgi:hypothetical protein